MVRKTYSIQAKPATKWGGMENGVVTFCTNDPEIFKAVTDFVEMAADAISYRNEIQRVQWHAIQED